jgi:hypothetical protein
MAHTLWLNVITGEWLDRHTLDELRACAHRAYEANPHIFEDEHDALAALGAIPVNELDLHRDSIPSSMLALAA